MTLGLLEPRLKRLVARGTFVGDTRQRTLGDGATDALRPVDRQPHEAFAQAFALYVEPLLELGALGIDAGEEVAAIDREQAVELCCSVDLLDREEDVEIGAEGAPA